MDERKRNTIGVVIRAVAAFLVTLAMVAAGAGLGVQMSEQTKDLIGWISVGCIGFLLLLLLVNLVASRLYKKSKDLTLRQMQEYYLARREEACRDLPRAVRKIVFLRHAVEVYSMVVAFLTLFVAFSIGVGSFSAGITIFPVYLLYGLFGRVLPEPGKYDFSHYTKPEDYPALHALAHKAATALGMDGEIRIVLLGDCNAGIAKIGKTYSLQLGVQLLGILNEEELYQVLLHEFAHLTKDGNSSDREFRLFTHITEREQNSFTVLLNALYLLPDVLYVFEYVFYRMTSSVSIESIADSAVLTHGDPQTAVNALAKIAYYDRFEWEMGEHIEEHFYQPEELRHDVVNVLAGTFRKVLSVRADFWKTLLMNEIEPRSASHPIFRNRMQALGVADFTVVLPAEDGSNYRAECKKASEQVNEELYEANKEDYTKRREESYLKPLKVVEDWRATGSAISAEEARPVMDALWELGYRKELEALCDRILSETENKFATAHAEMTKGVLLLRRYDKNGIDHIYRAMEINKNYVEEGLDEIGQFCCMMGLQKELDEYRERAVELGQYQHDEYSKTGELNAGDDLRPEQLPDGMLESILDYITAADETKSIFRIYLVRKVVSESFFTSAFVIEFRKDASEEAADAVMDKMFNHLDTRPEDWQFSLFAYDEGTAAAVKKVKGCCVYEAK